MKKLFLKFLLLSFFILSISGCSCKKENDLIIYRNYYDQDVTTFNYIITNEYQDITRYANLVDGLVENDKYGNIVPSIAKSWKSEIIEDKQIWTFYLREDVYWSNYKGDKYDLVTAHDFVTSLKYSLNYNVKSNNYNLPSILLENGLNYYNATLIRNYNYEDIVNKITELHNSDSTNLLYIYENIKNVFDTCNESKMCIDDFSTVGVKAISDFELQFTLTSPVPYFLSALNYSAFLPANEKFIKEIGFNNFGTSKKTLLYNGAYILSDYFHSSRIEYIKNKNYWDIDNVFIDKLIFTKALNYHSPNFSRLAYESGNIDEFTVMQEDEIGWNKYVLGINKNGSKTNPSGNNTYVNFENTNFITYYLIFNQNRINSKYTTLSKDEIEITNKALSNDNFRKALTHGINRQLYLNNDLNSLISSLVPNNFSYMGDKDYYTYLIETYSNKNNLNLYDAENLLKEDPYYSINKSSYYLEQALKELNIPEEDLPIKIEYTYYLNDEYSLYDKNRIDLWNKELNGCSIDLNECNYDKVMIVYNEEVNNINNYNVAFSNKEYNLTFIGLYPDYNDPTTYLKSFASNGELYSYINHIYGSHIDNLLNNINKYYTDEYLDYRYKLCSELEYYILFEKNLALPLTMKSTIEQIVVSNLVPYTKMKASYGLSPFKFKHRKIRTTEYTQADIAKLKEEYEKGKTES